jgi:poly-gamma-glutamate capsule biosynthesis protein CapA/YwtB (metallophosphatase superfamily)
VDLRKVGDIRLALSGDSIVTRRIAVQRDEPTRKLIEYIRGTDVAFTNLEVLPNDFRGYPAVESGGTHLAARAWVLDELSEMGFNLFACANNHSLDYSIDGLLATLEALEERGLAFAGIGRTLGEARMPAYLDHGWGSVGMIACASTFAKGQEAGEQRPEMQGRPGVNPLRFETTYEVTSEQLSALKWIVEDLGLEQQRQEFVELGFVFPPDDPDVLHLLEYNLRSGPRLNANFRVADSPSVKTTPRVRDLEAIAQWTREARMRADTVVVSFHAHEQRDTKEEPADFVRTFAHRMVEEGADVVVGHGPHLLRGMEIYQDKPIFYSLGNFAGQNEMVYKLPSDAYEQFRVERSKTPSEVFRSRTQEDRKSFPADKRYWQTILPVCTFEAGQLADLELVPVSLGHGDAPHRRGRPRLAEGEEATEILSRFRELSGKLGATIVEEEDRAVVQLG